MYRRSKELSQFPIVGKNSQFLVICYDDDALQLSMTKQQQMHWANYRTVEPQVLRGVVPNFVPVQLHPLPFYRTIYTEPQLLL